MVKHTIRTKDGGFIELQYARGQAIRLHCTECMGWEEHPKDCSAVHCALYPYRGRTRMSNESEGE